MTYRLAPNQLDEILALQLSVAWAGEAAGDPRRLGWWKTDLVDLEGGGDLFARLVPQTAAWASLSLVRTAARRIDATAREKLARGDEIWTPFHLGFLVDEQVDDRIAHHRVHRHVPSEVLGPRYLAAHPWSKPTFEALLARLGSPDVTVSLAGRLVEARAGSPADAVPLLFAALMPLEATYPMPYIEAAK
jgi:hypothetical protein